MEKMVWRYDDRQNGDLKEEEETPGKDKGSGQYGAVDSKAMEVDEIDFGDSKQKVKTKRRKLLKYRLGWHIRL